MEMHEKLQKAITNCWFLLKLFEWGTSKPGSHPKKTIPLPMVAFHGACVRVVLSFQGAGPLLGFVKGAAVVTK